MWCSVSGLVSSSSLKSGLSVGSVYSSSSGLKGGVVGSLVSGVVKVGSSGVSSEVSSEISVFWLVVEEGVLGSGSSDSSLYSTTIS